MLTPTFFSALIVAVIIIGLALAVVRLYADFSRPLLPERPPYPPIQRANIGPNHGVGQNDDGSAGEYGGAGEYGDKE